MKKKKTANLIMVLIIAAIAIAGVVTAFMLKTSTGDGLGSQYQIRELKDNAVITPGQEDHVCTITIPIPNFKAIFAIIMLSGIAFGPEAGFLVGAVSAFASNFFYGQGAYTPWQMFAYGAGGMLAGFLFAKGRLPQKRWVMAVFGFLACVLFVGPLLDTCTVFLTLPVINAQTAWPLYISGFPVNISQGVCTALTMVLFGPALLEKLDRVKLQYGMTEDGNGV